MAFDLFFLLFIVKIFIVSFCCFSLVFTCTFVFGVMVQLKHKLFEGASETEMTY